MDRLETYLYYIGCLRARNFHLALSRRHTSQRIRRVGDKEIIDAMVRNSVAIQHYILGRKHFSQLSGLPIEMKSARANTRASQTEWNLDRHHNGYQFFRFCCCKPFFCTVAFSYLPCSMTGFPQYAQSW
jgi:hypothetical protein